MSRIASLSLIRLFTVVALGVMTVDAAVHPAEVTPASRSALQQTDLEGFFRDYGDLKATPWANWHLEETEWKRYLEIKANTPFGIWQHTATPYQILATYSSTDQEKRRYARLEAKMDQWREESSLTYQQIYNDEREIVFAHYSALVRNLSPTIANTRSGDRVAFFTRPSECNPRCVGLMQRLLGTGAHIDIYVLGAKTEQDIFEWAKTASVPKDRVHIGQITLNFDKGEFANLSSLPEVLVELPVAYIRKGQEFERLAL